MSAKRPQKQPAQPLIEDDPFDLGDDEIESLPNLANIQAKGQDAETSISPSISQRATARARPPQQLTQALDSMNDAQREAVLAPDRPLLVLAGAGTGKTRVLTTRIAYKLATRQAWPSQILAVTFTNKAAKEMKGRISQLVGAEIEGMAWLGTFHSIAAKILRRHAEIVDLRPDFTILDTDDVIRLLKQFIKADNIDEKRWPARLLAGYIDRWKNLGLTPNQVPPDEDKAFANGKGKKLYALYQKRLKILNAVDFGDLLLECLRLFQENGDILADYQNRFRHILVDEYQDTNTVQYLWLRLLAQAHSNICCVGDDDQSIYGWRGAEVGNILRFEKDFTGAQIIRLERNYRSTCHILGAASGLIAHNKNRLGKTLWTQSKEGEKVKVRGAWDGEQEAVMTASDIESYQAKGHKLNEMAVLVRAGFQMREFEDRFIKLDLPYRVIGGPRFYERAEIRDANAYLRLINQADDDLAFERICNKPRRGFGDMAMQTFHKLARKENISLSKAAELLVESDELRPTTRRALASFNADLARWRAQKDKIPHNELAGLVLDESGYINMWQAVKTPDAPGRLDNLKELVSSMAEFSSLDEYLEHIALVLEAAGDDVEDKISLMTLHAAKGTEFETVFLPGWEEEIFPNPRTLEEAGNEGLEEERRLAHVGLTRAKKRALISFAGTRQIHGTWETNIPSRFIDEIPEEHAVAESSDPDAVLDSKQMQARDDNGRDNGKSKGTRKRRKFAKTDKIIDATVKDSAPASEGFECGARIFHQKFGYGRVEAVEGNKLQVAFEKAGNKKVLDSFVERA